MSAVLQGPEIRSFESPEEALGVASSRMQDGTSRSTAFATPEEALGIDHRPSAAGYGSPEEALGFPPPTQQPHSNVPAGGGVTYQDLIRNPSYAVGFQSLPPNPVVHAQTETANLAPSTGLPNLGTPAIDASREYLTPKPIPPIGAAPGTFSPLEDTTISAIKGGATLASQLAPFALYQNPGAALDLQRRLRDFQEINTGGGAPDEGALPATARAIGTFAGENLPPMIPQVVGAVVGGALGSLVAPGPGTIAGAVAGSGLGAVPGATEHAQETYQRTGSTARALGVGALDVGLGAAQGIPAVGGPLAGTAERLAKNAIARAFIETGGELASANGIGLVQKYLGEEIGAVPPEQRQSILDALASSTALYALMKGGHVAASALTGGTARGTALDQPAGNQDALRPAPVAGEVQPGRMGGRNEPGTAAPDAVAPEVRAQEPPAAEVPGGGQPAAGRQAPPDGRSAVAPDSGTAGATDANAVAQVDTGAGGAKVPTPPHLMSNVALLAELDASPYQVEGLTTRKEYIAAVKALRAMGEQGVRDAQTVPPETQRTATPEKGAPGALLNPDQPSGLSAPQPPWDRAKGTLGPSAQTEVPPPDAPKAAALSGKAPDAGSVAQHFADLNSGAHSGAVFDTLAKNLTDAKTWTKDALEALPARLAGRTLPEVQAAAPDTAMSMIRYATSRTAVDHVARDMAAEVMGTKYKDTEFARRVGAVLAEDNLRSIRQDLTDKAAQAKNPEEGAAFDAAAKKVVSLIGAPGAPFATEADYRAALADKDVREAINRHKNVVMPWMDRTYRALQSIDPEAELAPRGLETGARINLKAIKPGEPEHAGAVSQTRGNLTNTRTQRSPFAIPAKGTGEAYAIDYNSILANTVGKTLERYNKRAMYDQIVKDGMGVINTEQVAPEVNGRRAVKFEIDVRGKPTGEGGATVEKKNLWVDPRIAPALRNALNVEGTLKDTALAKVAGLVNKAQMAGPTDAIIHTANVIGAVAVSPGGANALGEIARRVPGVNFLNAVGRIAYNAGRVIADSPEIRSQLAQLADVGGVRGQAHGGLSGKLIAVVDQAARLSLDNLYTSLVDRKVLTDNPLTRHEFASQAGQYQGRLMGRITRMLREGGVAPFVVAGTTMNHNAVRGGLLGLPPVAGATHAATAQMVATAWLGKAIGLFALAPTLNYLLTGKLWGRPYVPIGAIDTGKDDDKGHPIYVDLLKLDLTRRGMRITGLDKTIEGAMSGRKSSNVAADAIRDVVSGVLHPYFGPAAQFASTALTGRDVLRGGVQTARSAPPGGSQALENLKDAMRQANPSVEAFLDGKAEGGTSEGLKRSVQTLGSAVGIKSAVPPNDAAREHAQAQEFADDVVRRGRKLPREALRAFVQAEVQKLPPEYRAKIGQEIVRRLTAPVARQQTAP